ncbi:type IV pilus assembly protein PilC [Candidatus Gastranaerophilus sp. (ex Termes propinquus)]|nr:type IV pilus assembly protein PilC [Candidatus Gastranaerophilus sp. (ex Termes propinquus)]
MPTYSYTALKNNKNVVRGKIDAGNEKEARNSIRKMGLLPTKITEEGLGAKSKKAGANKAAKKGKFKSMSLKHKIDLTSTLQILTATGIPIIETLVFLENNADAKIIRETATELKAQIIAGSTLAETLERHRHVFGRVFCGLVKAGEDSGELDRTLERMLELLKKQDVTKAKVTGALVYPVFVIILAILIVLVLLMFVFPKFEEMFENLGRELPIYTRICIDSGKALAEYWYVLILVIFGIIFSIWKLFTTEVTRKYIDRIALRIFLVKDLVTFANFSNFTSVMQVAYDAGIPIIDCLYLSNLTIENVVLRESILSAASKVQQGTHLSVALRSTGVVPGMMLFMMATGEQTGRLGEMLQHTTRFIDNKLDGIIDTFTKLIEPFMMVIIGGIVLFMALALYMPLFGSYGA